MYSTRGWGSCARHCCAAAAAAKRGAHVSVGTIFNDELYNMCAPIRIYVWCRYPRNTWMCHFQRVHRDGREVQVRRETNRAASRRCHKGTERNATQRDGTGRDARRDFVLKCGGGGGNAETRRKTNTDANEMIVCEIARCSRSVCSRRIIVPFDNLNRTNVDAVVLCPNQQSVRRQWKPMTSATVSDT